MPREWLRGRLPNNEIVRAQLGMQDTDQGWLKNRLSDPTLWHLNRRTAAGGIAVGLFISWIPVPLQMIVAAFIAAVLRVHVPLSVVMVWFTNPLTIVPLLYAARYAGSTILQQPPGTNAIELSLPGFFSSLTQAGPVLATGALFCAILTALFGYLITSMVWRWSAMRRWRQRIRSSKSYRRSCRRSCRK